MFVQKKGVHRTYRQIRAGVKRAQERDMFGNGQYLQRESNLAYLLTETGQKIGRK